MTTYSDDFHYEYCMGDSACKLGGPHCPHNHFLKNEECNCSPNKSTNKIEEKINFWASKLQIRTVQNHPPVRITAEDEANLEKAVAGLKALFKELAEEALPRKFSNSAMTTTETNQYGAGYNHAIDKTKANINKLIGGGDE